jgi:hypothetical protein
VIAGLALIAWAKRRSASKQGGVPAAAVPADSR